MIAAKQRTQIWENTSNEFWKIAQIEANHLARIYRKVPDFSFNMFNILDIGSGLAGYNILLVKDISNVNIDMLDFDQHEEAFKLGFASMGEKYNSFTIVNDLIADCGVDSSRIKLFDANQLEENENFLNSSKPYDFVQSLYSWCFHFPYLTYRSFVQAHIHPSTLVLVDVRRNHEQEKQIMEDFEIIEVILERSKSRRLLLKKQLN